MLGKKLHFYANCESETNLDGVGLPVVQASFHFDFF